MTIETKEGGDIKGEDSGELGSIAQFVVPEFLVLGARIAKQAEYLFEVGGKENGLRVDIQGGVVSGRLAQGLGRGRPQGMPAAGRTPGQAPTGFGLQGRCTRCAP